MQLVEDSSIVRGMIRVDHGEDLVVALSTLARAAGWQDAFVTGAGRFELIELRRGQSVHTYEDAEVVALAGRVRRVDGRVEVSLTTTVLVASGTAEGRIEAALAAGMVLVVDAIAGDAEADVEAPLAGFASAGGVAAEPSTPASSSPGGPPSGIPASDSASGVRPSSPTAAPSAPSPNGTLPPFEATSRALRPPKRSASSPGLDPDDQDNPHVDIGDILIHPQLGRLDIVGEDSGGGVKVRMESGKVRVIRLDALIVVPTDEPDVDGGRTFRVQGPRRRVGRF